MSSNSHIQAMNAYLSMANNARYRPCAPGDGFGNIVAPLDQLDVNDEARRYATGWMEEEDRGEYAIGCPSYEDRAALVYVIEAARLICGVDRLRGAELLRMAIADIESRAA